MRIGRKAEWLVGDGAAWIDSKIKLDKENYINVSFFNNYEESKSLWIVGNNARQLNLYMQHQAVILNRINKNGPKATIVYFSNVLSEKNTIISRQFVPIQGENNVFVNKDYTNINGINYTFENNFEEGLDYDEATYRLYRPSARFLPVDGRISTESIIGRCEIGRNNQPLVIFTPLVLTSDIPPYLASDNLPHSAGECGMWDSIGEKFYGNANTAGEFTVENELDEYVEVDLTGICINGKYQRVEAENSEIPQVVWNGVNVRMLMLNGKAVWKDGLVENYDFKTYPWLCSETFDYIKIPEQQNLVLEYKNFSSGFILGSRIENAVIANSFVFFITSHVINLNLNGTMTGLSYPSSGIISINEQKVDGYNLSYNGFFHIFASPTDTLKRESKGRIGHILGDNINMLPAKLLRDIPAIFAADNKPHCQGECGMFDSVSKKFYGKSSNNGDFYVI